MNNILEAFNRFQIADLDDDMVGMCVELVNWLKVCRSNFPNNNFSQPVTPETFYKLDPHQPRMELRKNLRKMMAHAVKYQKEDDELTKTQNIFTVVLTATYIYHMPTDKMFEASLSSSEFTRDLAKEMLLNDNMSPNWLKEPSERDFSAIML